MNNLDKEIWVRTDSRSPNYENTLFFYRNKHKTGEIGIAFRYGYKDIISNLSVRYDSPSPYYQDRKLEKHEIVLLKLQGKL